MTHGKQSKLKGVLCDDGNHGRKTDPKLNEQLKEESSSGQMIWSCPY